MAAPDLRGRCVLHVIAHPDDEHAGALAWWSRVAGARVHVYSFTRGEAGANVTGPETGADLGLLRTAELAAACRIYGCESVSFGSAPDYGFSRRLDECWGKWDRARLLAELVACIRRLRPALVASRFFGGPGDGHAHHQAAGVLAREAFAAAADAGFAAAALIAGELPAGARADLEVDARAEIAPGETCLDVANRGYRQHRSQDPAHLLAHVVDHATARYQCVAGDLAALAAAPRAEPAPAAPRPFDTRGPIDLGALAPAPHIVDDAGAPLAALPPLAITQPPLLVTDAAGCDLAVTIESRAPTPLSATAFRRGPTGDGPERALTLAPGERATLELALPPGLGARAELTTVVRAGDQELGARLVELDTPLGRVTAVRPARVLAVRANARVAADTRVALFAGPDPALPRALAQLGVDVFAADTAAWPQVDWRGARVAFVDARAYAVTAALRADSAPLTAFARGGGHVVVCHQTPEYDPARHAPFPGTLPVDADEACEEDEPARLLALDHVLLSAPNRITAADFDGWNDARGSKFWSDWSDAYEPLVELCDRGRPPARGVFLTARVGRGRYTYCALALGRQVAAGVPGGFRLLANLVGNP